VNDKIYRSVFDCHARIIYHAHHIRATDDNINEFVLQCVT